MGHLGADSPRGAGERELLEPELGEVLAAEPVEGGWRGQVAGRGATSRPEGEVLVPWRDPRQLA